MLLFGVAAFVLFEAWQRFNQPPEVASGLMLVVALVGVAAIASRCCCCARRSGSLNMRGAYLEVLGDLLGSAAVIVAAVVIAADGFDRRGSSRRCSSRLMILPRTCALLRDATDVLLEATPKGVDMDHVRRHILEAPGVVDCHDLHAWTITSGMNVVSAHVVLAQGADPGTVLDTLCACLSDDFDIEHTHVPARDRGPPPARGPQPRLSPEIRSGEGGPDAPPAGVKSFATPDQLRELPLVRDRRASVGELDEVHVGTLPVSIAGLEMVGTGHCRPLGLNDVWTTRCGLRDRGTRCRVCAQREPAVRLRAVPQEVTVRHRRKGPARQVGCHLRRRTECGGSAWCRAAACSRWRPAVRAPVLGRGLRPPPQIEAGSDVGVIYHQWSKPGLLDAFGTSRTGASRSSSTRRTERADRTAPCRRRRAIWPTGRDRAGDRRRRSTRAVRDRHR